MNAISLVEHSEPFVFVLMPFKRRFNNVYQLVIKPLENQLGVIVNRADELPFDNRQIYDQIIAAIDSADVIVADLSGNNPNVFYELGYAHARAKIVVPLSSEKLPFDVAGFRTIFYELDDLPSLGTELVSRVAEALRQVRDRQEKTTHPIMRRYPDLVATLQEYALTKAKESDWSRPGMYFTGDQIVRETNVTQELAYLTLDALRDMGLITCVNWKGQSVWMASQKLRDVAPDLG